MDWWKWGRWKSDLQVAAVVDPATGTVSGASQGIPNMTDLLEKAKSFRALHQRQGAFIIPNPWDIGSARLLAQLGFEALATTSMGYAFSRGQLDNTVDRKQTMAYAAEIASATDLPVSADLENGFGDAPEIVAETIRTASETGIVGGSIEDSTSRINDPIYEIGLAKERVRAAVEAARALPFPFTLTARAENYLHGRPDIKDTVQRLQAYQETGADVLYAPGLTSRDDIAAVVSSVDRPVSVVMGLRGAQLSMAELATLGVKRISVGSALYRTAMGAFLAAAREMREQGSFTFAAKAASPKEIGTMLQD
jgi:2-methylisocitrate lyase-like PEP mutase family enzyme